MALRNGTFVVLDFETNGLSPARGGEVVEVGAVRVKRGEVAGTFETLTRSNHAIPPAAVDIHGITDGMLADAPHFVEVVRDLLAFLGDAVVVAHNAGFDRSFLFAGVDLVGARRPGNPFLDTLKLARALDPQFDRHDLGSLCVQYGVTRTARHRALPDAEATAALLIRFLGRLDEIGVRTFPQLLDVAGCDPVPVDEPIEPFLTREERTRLEEAADLGDRVVIGYRTASGAVKEARVVPYAVDRVGSRERLIAFDLDRDVTRSLRLDRLVTVRP